MKTTKQQGTSDRSGNQKRQKVALTCEGNIIY